MASSCDGTQPPNYFQQWQQQQQQSDQQYNQLQQNIDNLKARYGVANYYDCLPKDYYTSGMASDPWYASASYNYAKYCLEQKEIVKERTPPACPAGTTLIGNNCVASDYDVICQQDYGVNSSFTGTFNDKGGLICGCKPDFDWNSARTACTQQTSVMDSIKDTIAKIRSQIQAQTQACQQAYGLNSQPYQYPDGSVVCRCKTGYQFNSDKTACVAISQQPTGTDYFGDGSGGGSGPPPAPLAQPCGRLKL